MSEQEGGDESGTKAGVGRRRGVEEGEWEGREVMRGRQEWGGREKNARGVEERERESDEYAGYCKSKSP